MVSWQQFLSRNLFNRREIHSVNAETTDCLTTELELGSKRNGLGFFTSTVC